MLPSSVRTHLAANHELSPQEPMKLLTSTLFSMLCLTAFAAAAQKPDVLPQKGDLPGFYPFPGTSLAPLVGGSNDCANAAANDAISGPGSFAVNTVGATTGVAPQPVGFSTIKNDVWFYWTATITGVARLETCNSVTVDTKAAAWASNNGTMCPSGTQLAYNDDACALQTRIQWDVTSGTTYFLQLGAFTEGVTYSGTFTLAILTPPTNDSCATPMAIAGNGPFAYDTLLATTGTQGQAEAACLSGGNTGIARDVWFLWTAGTTGAVGVSTCGGTLDTKVAVYPASGCPIAGTAIACNDDFCGAQARPNFSATAGTSYLIQLGADPTNGTTTGSGSFTIVDATPPANDNCTTPTSISGSGPFPYDNMNATTGAQGQTEAPCLSGGQTGIARDVWFLWTAGITGVAGVSTCGGTLDTKVAVYPAGGCPGAGTALACNDDYCGAQARPTFSAVAGTSYLIQLGADPTNATTAGSGSFMVVDTTPPTNDSCATPMIIGGAGPFMFDNTFATTGAEGQAEQLCLNAGTSMITKDLWYRWTPTLSGPVSVSTCNLLTVPPGTTQDSKIAIYAGSGCPVAAAIACNDDAACAASGLNATVMFTATCGQTYMIQVGQYSQTLTVSVAGAFAITESGTSCGPPATPFCFGDGTGLACPCGNSGTAGNGCASSVNAAGGRLTTSGQASISADTLALIGSGMPNSSALYFQGSATLGGGNGSPFGDGLRCAGGSVIRMGTKSNSAGASQYPVGADQPVSIRGLNSAGAFRVYQVWYRNAAVFCTPSTFNLTNGVSVTWGA